MSRAFDTAYEFIKNNILTGAYLPSQKLIESELSKAINVSRNTIKKALLKLEQENLVLLENNKGAVVKALNLEDVINYFEIREALEGIIAKTAVANITDDQLTQLESTLNLMKKCLDEKEFTQYSVCNKAFHTIIYEASSNTQAVQMAQVIKVQLQRLSSKTLALPERPHASFQEHSNIFQAFKESDAEKAQQLIQQHVASVKETIIEYYALFT